MYTYRTVSQLCWWGLLWLLRSDHQGRPPTTDCSHVVSLNSQMTCLDVRRWPDWPGRQCRLCRCRHCSEMTGDLTPRWMWTSYSSLNTTQHVHRYMISSSDRRVKSCFWRYNRFDWDKTNDYTWYRTLKYKKLSILCNPSLIPMASRFHI